MCSKPLQPKHFLFIVALSLFFSLLLFYTSYCLYSFSAFLSFLTLISSTLLHLLSNLFFFFFSSLYFLLFSSHLLLYSLLLHCLSCSLLLFCFYSSCNSNKCFCNFNIITLFSITYFNNFIASFSLINPSIFT